MAGAGTTTIAAGATMTVTSANNHYGLVVDDTRTVINNGTITVTGTAGGWGHLDLDTTDTGHQQRPARAPRRRRHLRLRHLRVAPRRGGPLDHRRRRDIGVPVELAGKIEPTAGTLTLTNTVTAAAGGSTTGVLSANGGTLLIPTSSTSRPARRSPPKPPASP